MHNKRFLQTSVYYSLIFMANAAFISYIALFFAEMNISETQIGILTSLSAVIGILANPFWGIRGDRAETKNRVLQWCQFMAAATVWLFPLAGGNFELLFVVTCIFFFFQAAVNPLSDAVSLELASREGFRFSTVRTAGSLGFALMSVAAGSLIELNINAIFFLYSLLLFSGFLMFTRLPAIKGHQRTQQKIQFWKVLQSASLRRIYLYVLALGSGFGFFISFHALYSIEQGISTGWLGVGIMLGSFSQFPFMLLFDKLYERFGIRNIILVSGLFNVVRWLLYAFWLNSYTLLFLWLLHGGSFILVYLCLTQYVHSHIRKELKASGQMMNFIVLNGAGRIIGGVLGGVTAERFGFGPVFAAAGILSLAAVVWFWTSTRRQPFAETPSAPA